MQYTLIFNDVAYDLPKFTKSIRKEIEKLNINNANTSIDLDKRVKDMYLFIKDKIGEENALEIFGTDDLEEMDINEITLCYIGICDGYDRPMKEHEKNKSAFDNVSEDDRKLILEVLKNSGNIQNIAKSVNSGVSFRPPMR